MYSKGRLLILSVSALFVAYAVVGGMLGTVEDARVKTLKELKLFSDVVSKIQSDYVDTPDLNKTLAGALQGLTDALDPYSSYVPASSVPSVKNRKERFKADIGAALSKRYGYGYVVAVLSGGPAEAAGLRSGDIIETIDGKHTTELSLAEMESLLVGPQDSQAQLMVIRTRNTEPTKISVNRKIQDIPAVQAKVLESDIGYLKIPAFTHGIANEASAKLRMLLSGKPSGLILDLRGSGFGDYDEAMKVADLFLPAGKTMATLKVRKEKVKDYISTGAAVDFSTPAVVLTSAGTSGPAELFAAALKENNRARVVGEKTSGTGSLQQALELEDGSLLILTTHLFYTPAGSSIESKNLRKAGVQPDEKVPDESFVTNFYYQNPNLTGDEQYNRLLAEVEKLQLQRAVELVRKSLKKAA